MPSKPIFISHAAKDKGIADGLADLLHQLKLNEDHIFCSSLEGMAIDEGKNFIEFIRSQIDKPKLVILLLSPHYFESTFCIAELGACWGLGHECFPLLIEPCDFTDMKAVLIGTQAGKVNDKHSLNNLKDWLMRTFGLSVSTARWENKRDDFLRKLPKLVEESGKPERVSLKQYQELVANYEEAKSELAKAEKRIERLEKAKDKADVERISLEDSGEEEQFEAFTEAAKDALDELPPVVVRMLSHEYGNTGFDPPAYETNTWEALRQAKVEGYVVDEDEALVPNEDDPKVGRAKSALDELKYWLTSASAGFVTAYRRKYEHQPDVSNQRFWRYHLGLR